MSILKNGYGVVPRYVFEDKRLTTTSKAIYTLLCVFKGNNNIANPKRETIMEYLNIGSKNTYYKHLDVLKDIGYIQVEYFHNVNKFSSNNYIIVDTINVEKKTVDLWSKGFIIVPRQMIQDKRLSIASKMVYTYLASYKNHSYPSTQMIRSNVSISQHKLYPALNELEEYSYIVRQNNKLEGKFTTNTYNLLGYDEEVDEELVNKINSKVNNKSLNDEIVVEEVSSESEHITEVSKDNDVAQERKQINKRQRVIKEKAKLQDNFEKAEKKLRKNLIMDKQEEDYKLISELKPSEVSLSQQVVKERYLFYKTSINLMLDIIFSKDEEIRIGTKTVNKDVLTELFFNIDYDTMLSVYTSISLNLGTIKNKKAYTLTAIYNAITTP